MDKLLKALMLLLVTTFSVTISACGGDEDEPGQKPNDDNLLVGYWYAEDVDGNYQILELLDGGVGTAYGQVVGTPAEMEENITWDSRRICRWVVLAIEDTELVLDNTFGLYERITLSQFRNLKRTGTLDGSGVNNPDTPDTPDTHPISSSDFVGTWYHSSGAFVFDLNSSGLCTAYKLKSYKGDKYVEKSTGTWEWDESSKSLSISTFLFGKESCTVTKLELPYGFTTTDGNWDVCSKLPTLYEESTPDNSPLAGTKWQGRVDGEVVTIEFKTNGKFTESWKDGDTTTDSYQVLDSNTLLIGEETVLANTFGSTVLFTLNSNKTVLTLTDSYGYEEWQLSRKM